MSNMTIIDSIGWHNDHIAVFKDDDLLIFSKINPTERSLEIKKIKESFIGNRVIELKCSPHYREFVSVSDFPKSLKEYFKY